MKNQNKFWMKKVFFGVVGVLSATTSFAFFLEIFKVSENWIISLGTGATGVLVTDLSAFAWLAIYRHETTSEHGRTFSIVGMALGVTGSVVCSFTWILSTTSIVELPVQTAVWSTVAVSCIIIVHFILVFFSSVMGDSDPKLA